MQVLALQLVFAADRARALLQRLRGYPCVAEVVAVSDQTQRSRRGFIHVEVGGRLRHIQALSRLQPTETEVVLVPPAFTVGLQQLGTHRSMSYAVAERARGAWTRDMDACDDS